MQLIVPAAIHPIFVHFAIALTLFGVGLDALALSTGRRGWHAAARLNLTWGVAGMALAVLAGWLDHERIHSGSSHTHGGSMLMEIHQVLGWTLLAVFSLLLVWRRRIGSGVSRSWVALAAAGALGILVQGHLGGQLVFLEGTGVRAVLQHSEGMPATEASADTSTKPGHAHDEHGDHDH